MYMMCTTNTHPHMHTRTHTCTHMHTRMHTCTHACTHAHTCTHACTHAHMHKHTRVHAHTRAHTHAHTYTHAHACMHARTHTDVKCCFPCHIDAHGIVHSVNVSNKSRKLLGLLKCDPTLIEKETTNSPTAHYSTLQLMESVGHPSHGYTSHSAISLQANTTIKQYH